MMIWYLVSGINYKKETARGTLVLCQNLRLCLFARDQARELHDVTRHYKYPVYFGHGLAWKKGDQAHARLPDEFGPDDDGECKGDHPDFPVLDGVVGRTGRSHPFGQRKLDRLRV